MGNQRPGAQCRESVRLGERPADDDVAIAIEQGNRGSTAEVGVGLVHEDDRLWCRLSQARDRVRRYRQAGGIPRVRDADERTLASSARSTASRGNDRSQAAECESVEVPAASAHAAYISNAGSTMTWSFARVARGCLRSDVQALVEPFVNCSHPAAMPSEPSRVP
jgi:hypothetical protein